MSLRAGSAFARALSLHNLTHSAYDEIAPIYDERYDTPEARAENEEVKQYVCSRFISGENVTVLDIGAGTGLAVELGLTNYPDGYIAVEPSLGMLSRLIEKYPDATTMPVTAAKIPKNTTFDLGLALFGSATYCTPPELRHISRLTRRNRAVTILMTYAQGYYPDFYEREPAAFPEARKALRGMREAQEIGNVGGKWDMWEVR